MITAEEAVAMSILVIDDDDKIRQALHTYLSDRGHPVYLASTGPQGLEVLQRESVDIVISDVHMPGMDGFEVLGEIQRISPGTEVIMITGFREIENAFRAMRQGAFDFFTKPLKIEELSASLQRTVRFRALRQEKERLERRVADTPSVGLDAILGESAGIMNVKKQIQRVSQVADTTVLVQGETGTGKELVARAIHAESARAPGPFVTVNCSALPESLVESEFYGHVKGAFTGAQEAREGLFERANGGTLFLDEIGDMDLAMQTRLLRTLEARTVVRLGDSKEIPVDVRVVSATHRDLGQAIAQERFREDLFYRLNTVAIHVPPLRERSEDIQPLADHFLRGYAAETGKQLVGFSAAASKSLREHPFPGNVRELRNMVERAAIFADRSTLSLEDLEFHQPSVSGPDGTHGTGFDVGKLEDLNLGAIEEMLIRESLHRSQGSLSGAGRLLGISREMVRTRMKTYGIAGEHQA